MAGTRGDDNSNCGNCQTLLEVINKLSDKMDGLNNKFNGIEASLKEENHKLHEKLIKIEKKYHATCVKMNEMSQEINRLKQENLSRNLLIKGVPEIETGSEHLKMMVGSIFIKLRARIEMTYVDCFRIGRAKENTCRPICVVLLNIGMKNQVIRDKRKMKLTCANFTNDSATWGPPDKLIYIDEHLTRENHLLFMYARKLKNHGFKFIWSRNGKIFVRLDDKSKTVHVESMFQVNKLISEAVKTLETGESEVMSQSDTDALDNLDTENDEVMLVVENFEKQMAKKTNKRKQHSPPNDNNPRSKLRTGNKRS